MSRDAGCIVVGTGIEVFFVGHDSWSEHVDDPEEDEQHRRASVNESLVEYEHIYLTFFLCQQPEYDHDERVSYDAECTDDHIHHYGNDVVSTQSVHYLGCCVFDGCGYCHVIHGGLKIYRIFKYYFLKFTCAILLKRLQCDKLTKTVQDPILWPISDRHRSVKVKQITERVALTASMSLQIFYASMV